VMPPIDGVDGSSTGTCVPSLGAVNAPKIQSLSVVGSYVFTEANSP